MSLHKEKAAEVALGAGGGHVSDVVITVLPPGRAYGCDDLQNWAGRRAAGYAGVRPSEKKSERLKRRAWEKIEKRLRKRKRP